MTTPDRDTLAQWDRDTVWHPFTQMAQWAEQDAVIVARGEGCELIDVNGRRYLDGTASMWTNVHGHAHPFLNQRLKEQLDSVAHTTLLGQASVPSILLARKLLDIAPPGMTRVFYSDNGSTAVEVALKMAFQYWRHRGESRRRRFLKLDLAYHGDTIGSVSLGGIDLFHAAYRDLLFPAVTAPTPFPYRCPAGEADCAGWALAEMEKQLAAHAGEIAAIVMEPRLQGAGGMIVHPDGYLRGVRKLADTYGTLLILDEVLTGFGRCGAQWACAQEGVSPDILATAKGLTAGYLPLAATLCREDIYAAFLGRHDEFKTFFHGHTFTGNPLGCAVALAGMELMGQPGWWDSLRARQRHFQHRLTAFRDLPRVGDVRVLGMAAGIELVRDVNSRAPLPIEEQWGIRVCRRAREHGLLIRPLGSTIVLMPILAMSVAELDRMLDSTALSIREICG